MDLVMLPETPRWHQRPCFSTLKMYEIFLVTLIISLSSILNQFSIVYSFSFLKHSCFTTLLFKHRLQGIDNAKDAICNTP